MCLFLWIWALCFVYIHLAYRFTYIIRKVNGFTFKTKIYINYYFYSIQLFLLFNAKNHVWLLFNSKTKFIYIYIYIYIWIFVTFLFVNVTNRIFLRSTNTHYRNWRRFFFWVLLNQLLVFCREKVLRRGLIR